MDRQMDDMMMPIVDHTAAKLILVHFEGENKESHGVNFLYF